jgi:cell wall-associated NlpC family hydrolase
VGAVRRAALAILTLALAAAIFLPGQASAARAAGSPGYQAAFSVARTRAGDPYSYGSAGPSAFDCSGLVQWAYGQAGIHLPRDTFEMLASGKLIPTAHPRRGDLAFFGTGHVEFYVRPGHTFGAQQTGTLVGWHSYGGWWAPTMFFRVRGAG